MGQLRHGSATPDRRHDALVAIVKRASRLVVKDAKNLRRAVATGLDRDGGELWLKAAGRWYRRRVTNAPDVVGPNDSKVITHERPPARSTSFLESLGQRAGRRDTGRPDDRRRLEPFTVGEAQRVLFDFHDGTSELDVDTHLLEFFLCVLACRLRKRRQQSWREVNQSNAHLRRVEAQSVTLDGDVDEL